LNCHILVDGVPNVIEPSDGSPFAPLTHPSGLGNRIGQAVCSPACGIAVKSFIVTPEIDRLEIAVKIAVDEKLMTNSRISAK
jgi:hypothetical protein